MVRPSETEVTALKRVAREICDMTEEHGYKVGLAVRQHAAFARTKGPASSMERSLVLDGARRGASQAGLTFEEVLGGGLDIVTHSDLTVRRYRVKRVRLNAGGDYEAICNGASTLMREEPESLLREEKWIIGYVLSDDHTIGHLLAAEVLDWRGDDPFYLVLGPPIDLTDDQPPQGFTSTDEGLAGFDEDDESGSAEGA